MDATDLAAPPTTRHDTSYELVTHLATGGMAELFIARRHDDRAAPYVVLKRVMPDQARNPHFVGMFLDEARLASRLNHPNIAQVLDVGRAGSSYYYTMEYVHGENVRDLLQLAVKKQVMVPLDVCLSILIGAATGLHAAHETRDRHGKHLGIVHRDVSPSNVMIGYDGGIKLVDFGVAKAADHTMETQSGTVKGKIAYLSPEQCTVQPVDRRSDVFSLGIVAFELVTRSRLFRRRSDYETMHAIVNDVVPPPSRLRAGVPPSIDAVILRALHRMPERRPQSTAEMADELNAVAAGLGLRVSAAVLADFMAELFGSRPLPWAQLEHHDTAVIALAALAPGLVPSEREPLEASVSAAEVVIEVDTALSSSVDQAFAAVKTTIAPPPREWGVGDEVPGVFTWPSRDEGVESVDATIMTSSPPRRVNPGFLPTDTVVTPPKPGNPAFPTARTETGAAPAPAPRRGAEPEAASTMKFGKVGWLDEVKTTIADRASAARKLAEGRGRAREEAPENPGPRDTVLDLREGPPGMAVDLAELRRRAGRPGSPASAKGKGGALVKPPVATVKLPPDSKAALAKAAAEVAASTSLDATIDDGGEITAEGVTSNDLDAHRGEPQEGPDPFDQRTTSPRSITLPPPTDPALPALMGPTELMVPAIPRIVAPARADSGPRPPAIVDSARAAIGARGESNPRATLPRQESGARMVVPPSADGPRAAAASIVDGNVGPATPRKDASSPRMTLPRQASGANIAVPVRKDDSSPRVPMPPVPVAVALPVPVAAPAPVPVSVRGSSPHAPVPPMHHDSSPRVVLPSPHDRGPRWRPHPGTGPNPLIASPGPAPGSTSTRRALIVVGLGALCGGAIAIGANLALRSPGRAAETAAEPVPTGSAPTPDPTSADVAALRTRARTARTDGDWELAYSLCRDGLRLAPSDVELTTICAHAACTARNAEAAGLYLRRVPQAEIADVRRRCLDAGVADPTRP